MPQQILKKDRAALRASIAKQAVGSLRKKALHDATLTVLDRRGLREGFSPTDYRRARADVRAYLPCMRDTVGRFVRCPHTGDDIPVPCRKCETCRERRRREWKTRARQEYLVSRAALFVTLTLRPRFRGMSNEEFSAEYQRFIKRLRKTGAIFRPMSTFERQKDGALHAHVLMFFCDGHGPKYRQIKRAWKTFGLADIRRVKNINGAASYAVKYLLKSSDEDVPRMRAAGKFGQAQEAARFLRSPLLDPLEDAIASGAAIPSGWGYRGGQFVRLEQKPPDLMRQWVSAEWWSSSHDAIPF